MSVRDCNGWQDELRCPACGSPQVIELRPAADLPMLRDGLPVPGLTWQQCGKAECLYCRSQFEFEQEEVVDE